MQEVRRKRAVEEQQQKGRRMLASPGSCSRSGGLSPCTPRITARRLPWRRGVQEEEGDEDAHGQGEKGQVPTPATVEEVQELMRVVFPLRRAL